MRNRMAKVYNGMALKMQAMRGTKEAATAAVLCTHVRHQCTGFAPLFVWQLPGRLHETPGRLAGA